MAPAQLKLPGAWTTRMDRADMTNDTPSPDLGGQDTPAAAARAVLEQLGERLIETTRARNELVVQIRSAVSMAGLNQLYTVDLVLECESTAETGRRIRLDALYDDIAEALAG